MEASKGDVQLHFRAGVGYLPWIGVVISILLLGGNIAATKVRRGQVPQVQHTPFRETRAATQQCNVVRLVSCLALFALQIELARWFGTYLNNGLCLLYGYCCLLSLLTMSRDRPSAVGVHLLALLLLSWSVFVYRNLWPLATYRLLPEDRAEAPLIWISGSILTVAGVVVPLISPREYVPRKPLENGEIPNPEQTASLISRLSFFYMEPMVLSAYRSPTFSGENLPPLCDDDDAEALIDCAYKHLDPLQSKSKRHVFFSLLRVFMWEHIEEVFLLVIMVLADFMQPLGVNRLLAYVESGGHDAYVRPWVWCIALFVGQISVSMISGRYMLVMGRIIARTQGVLTQLIFDYALRVRAFDTHTTPQPSASEDETIAETDSTSSTLHNQSRSNASEVEENAKPANQAKAISIGTLNNLIATDIANIDEGQYWILTGFYTPAQIVVSIAFLYVVLDWSALVGIATMGVLLPIPGLVAKYSHGIQVARMKKSDTRVETVTEVMSGAIRMVKLFGWETQMNERIDQQRREEITVLRKYKLISLITTVMNQIILIATMVATFVTFTIVMKQSLTASRVFSSITVFQWLQRHFQGISEQLPGLINAKVSLDRIDNFLKNSDLVDSAAGISSVLATPTVTVDDSEVIGIRDAFFTWNHAGAEDRFRLTIEGELIFPRGKVSLIVGQTGSGKTSMLMALLGEMHYHPTNACSFVRLPRAQGVAYQAQESWILNETIRENILFGTPLHESRYKEVIRQCALESDLALFKAGDMTEVGERGITLSGGQKARITLARAVYSNAEILLLDDVFAALDAHTASWIVKECLNGELVQGRTVILATHSLALLTPIAHFVVSLHLDGRIHTQGSMQKVIEDDNTLSDIYSEQKNNSEKLDDEKPSSAVDSVDVVSEGGKLIAEEEVSEGHVGWSAVQLLLGNMAASPQGLVIFWISFLVPVFGTHSTSILFTWVLGRWAHQYEERDPKDVAVTYYLSLYLAVVGFNVLCVMSKYIAFTFGSLRASQVLHRLLIDSVLRSTLRWLDKTPTSRIIARCTQDIASVDGPVASYFSLLMDITAVLILRFATIVVMSPAYTIPSSIIGVLVGWIGQLYIKAQLAVKREMSNARAPVLGHFGAAVSGLVSVRAYGAQAAFHMESRKRVNRWVRAARVFSSLNKWVSIRSEILAAAFNAGLATYLIYRSSLDASAIGFTLAMSVVFSNLVLWWVRYFNEFEISGNSLERIQQYLNIEHEPVATPKGTPPAYWPASGHVRVENLSAKYSETGPDVLRGISFEIKSGERVGIVGRTGSGKSSLTLALLRCILTEGKVYFDGIATDTINLDALRSAITIIPQVPELLSGTLRENVDPFSEHDDAYLNEMLRAAGLFSMNRDKFGEQLTLDSKISSAGKNLSVGQRQMIALARAMVRRSRLLILDEATSAIDYETDAIIQASLRKEVAKDVSVLTIAHRLHTVVDSDKIMVLDNGRIIEYGSPGDLLKNPDGALRALVDSSADKEQLLARVAVT